MKACIEFVTQERTASMQEAGVTKPGWYFWNELWTTAVGPYVSEWEASFFHRKYFAALPELGDPV